MWRHNYEPVAGSLGASAAVAAVPIVVLFVMLGVLRKPAWMSALSALVSALIVALAVYGMPVQLALISTLYGAAYGLFPIAWIVFSSIMLYRLAVDTGKFEVINLVRYGTKWHLEPSVPPPGPCIKDGSNQSGRGSQGGCEGILGQVRNRQQNKCSCHAVQGQ